MLEEFSNDPANRLRPMLVDAAREITDVPQYEYYLDERLLVEEAIAEVSRKNTDSDVWTFARGNYRHVYNDEPVHEDERLTDPVSGIEQIWSEQIDSLLEQKRDTGQPVVLLDFGGGSGHSFIRVAAQEKFQQAIEKGDLVFIVTNLGFVPSAEPDQEGYSEIARSMNTTNHADPAVFRYVTAYTPDELQFVQANQGKVTYLDANALELAKEAVTTPDGGTLPLKGAVDIIHESYAVMHTHVPDVALAVFGELLGDQGTLYLSAKKGNYMHAPKVDEVTVGDGRIIPIDSGNAPTYYEAHQTALDVGIRAIQNMGLVLHESPSPYGPAVYAKDHA